MIFSCISVRFRDGIPNVNFNETPTYHEVDPKVVVPKRALKPGVVVLVKTIGMPQVKLIVDRTNEAKQLGGQICGKATFFDPVDNDTPWLTPHLQ